MTDIALGSLNQTFLRASAVLHADIALGTHMKPSLKPILEGYRGDIEVIAQTLKAEVLFFFHGVNVLGI
jgi:dethiobiotin synthetase